MLNCMQIIFLLATNSYDNSISLENELITKQTVEDDLKHLEVYEILLYNICDYNYRK